MSVIACLGWGSLVWDPRELPVLSQWSADGPLVPVEFTRQSDNGRITLALTGGVESVRCLWAAMDAKSVPDAVSALRTRENIRPENEAKHIGTWSTGGQAFRSIPDLDDWAAAHNVEHVIWTNLPPKFDGRRRTPSMDEVVTYLGSLSGEQKDEAEQYVRRAPRQVNTRYRRRIEEILGWLPIDPA